MYFQVDTTLVSNLFHATQEEKGTYLDNVSN